MLGYITFEEFRVLYPMLQQNELIGYKTSMESALMKLDPQQEQLVRFDPFLKWVELQDPSDGNQKSKFIIIIKLKLLPSFYIYKCYPPFFRCFYLYSAAAAIVWRSG